MKVPSPTSGRVRPAGGQLAYTQGASNPGAAGQLIARGLGNLSEAQLRAEAELRQRDQQTEKFNAARRFSEFETNTAQGLTDLKRNYRPDGKGYATTAQTFYDEAEQRFIGSLEPELQEEFRARAGEVKQKVMLDSFSFQYQAGDAWYKQGIDDELNKSKTMVDQDPQLLAAQQQKMFDTIDASDLPIIQKEDLKRNVAIDLASVQYKARVRADATAVGSIGVGGPSSVETVVNRIIGAESGGNPNAQNPKSSASGVGQFLDSTWVKTVRTHRPDIAEGRTDAELIALKTDRALGKEMTTRLTEENAQVLARQGLPATATNIYLTHFAGQGGGPAIIKASPDTPISEILSDDAIRANPEVLGGGATAGSVRAWAARKMRSSAVESDPAYDVIPFEDRVALRDDAEREAAAAINQQNLLQKQQKDNQVNSLLLGLLDGTKGQADIDIARRDGWLDSYENVNKAQTVLRQKNEAVALEGGALAKLQTPGAVWDPGNTDDKKMLNALIGKEGLNKIAQGDRQYVTDAVVPLVNQTGDVPTDVAGTLTGMLRSSNNTQAMFALDAMAQLQDTNELAFNQRFGSDVARNVDLWQARKDVTPQEELLNMVRGGTTQAERQARAVLRKEAEDILSRTENGVPVGRGLLQQVVGEFGGFFTSANQYTSPFANQALEREFQTQFVDAYSKVGNTEEAVTLAQKELARTWAVTEVGDRSILMKYPPEKVGYRKVMGSYDWINEQAKSDLQLKPDEGFELFSDEQTRQEWQAFQRNPNAAPPSYRVFTVDKNGVAAERLDENGRPARLNFKVPAEVQAKENAVYDFNDRRKQLQETIDEYQRIKEAAFYRGEQIAEEDTQAYDAAVKELSTLVDPRTPDPFVENIGNPMMFPLGGN